MKNSIKIIIGIVIVLVLVNIVFFSGLTGHAVNNDKKTIKIGVILPLSGSLSFFGIATQKAVILAQSELKDTKYNYQVIFEDDKMNPTESAIAAQKLINIDGVDAIISETSGPGNVIAPIAEENKVVHIGIASDPNIAKGEYNFIHWTTPQAENVVFVEEIQRLGVKKLALLSINQQGMLANAVDMQERLKGTGISFDMQKANMGDKDFKTQFMKLQEKNPDLYVLFAFSPEIELMAKQARELGITKLTSIESFEYTEQPQLFEGLWYVQAADPTQKFSNEFQAKYGENPGVGAPNGYDSFNLLVYSFEKAGKDTKKAAEVLSQVKNFEGALGNLNVDSEGIVQSKASVKEVKNGKFITIRS